MDRNSKSHQFQKYSINPDYMDLILRIATLHNVNPNSTLVLCFLMFDRADFVLKENIDKAYFDQPLPIGEGQTISQPYTVFFMMKMLELQVRNKVLEIGFGSGWQTALLSCLIGKSGQVHATEINQNLKLLGEKNLSKYHLTNIKTYKSEISELGLTALKPFDRIICAAAAKNEVPDTLIDQLNVGGVLVMPVDDTIVKIIKINSHDYEKIVFPGFSFVPLIY